MHSLAFVFLALLGLSFLLFQDGLWIYLDNGFSIQTAFEQGSDFTRNFTVFNNHTSYWGNDNSTHNSFRIVQTALLKFQRQLLSETSAQIIYFCLILFLVFFFANKLFRELGIKNYKITSILYTFNPLTVYLLSQSGYATAYLSPLLIGYAFQKILHLNILRWKYIILIAVGVNTSFAYPRLTILYIVLMILFALFIFFNERRYFTKALLVKMTAVGVITILCNIFILNNFIFNYLIDSRYTSSALEYTERFSESYGPIFYKNNSIKPFYEGFIFQEVTPNFSSAWQKTDTFMIGSLSFVFFVVIVAFRNATKGRNHKLVWSLGLYLVFIPIIVLAKYVSGKIFILFTYSLFPALLNNTSWLYFLIFFFFVLLFGYTLESADRKQWVKIMLYSLAIIYVFISMYPLVDYRANIQLKKIDLKKIPESVSNLFIKPVSGFPEGTMYYPDGEVIFNWSDYPINIASYSYYINLLSGNTRLTTRRQADLMEQMKSEKILKNYRLLNLKNIILFTGIQNNDHKLPFYKTTDLLQQIEPMREKIVAQLTDLSLRETNPYFTKYSFQGSENYDYFTYSPKQTFEKNSDVFSQENILIENRPVLIEKMSFQKPENIQYGPTSQDIRVSLKSSLLNATKHYVKFENVDTSKPFILQMNQTFGPSWKLKWVDEEYWNEKSCLTELKYYPITNNERCEYHSKLLEFEDVRLLGRQGVPERNHFEGNFIGNAWLVQPDDIPHQNRNSKTLYAVIIYEKQIYYMYSLLVSGLTFLVLILLAVRQEWRLWRGRKNPVIIKVQS